MAKNFFQDMIKMKEDLRKESGRPSVVKVRSEPSGEAEKEKNFSESPLESKVRRRVEYTETSGGKPRFLLWVVAGGALVFLFFAVSFLFSDATVTINTKTQDINLNQNLSATKDGTGDDLSFSLVVLSGEERKIIQGGDVKDVKLSAKGKVVIFNKFSTATQRLDINTRLEGSNGKIYKTEKAVVVPGMKGSTPGSIEVGIYANEPGGSYNSGPLDFKILGFKGTPKYTKFDGRSQGDISGGFIGKASSVSDTQKTSVLTDLRALLKDKLGKQATGQIPEGFILFQDANFFNIDKETVASGTSTEVPVSVKGTFYGFIFKESDLTEKLASLSIKDWDGNEVFISNIKDLAFLPLTKDGTADVQNISFNLFGAAKFVWKFDVEKFVGELAGKSKKDFNTILAGYKDIESANVTLRPFWKRSFPGSASKIKVLVNYPK